MATKPQEYFETYTGAISYMMQAISLQGFHITDDEAFDKIGVNSKRPSAGEYTKVSLEIMKADKLQKKMLHVQVYNRETKAFPYELNFYIL